ncbi:UNVERIFIED_CONTAM: hypothetical protein RMT77_008978 [Armadillidium vulgare]
MTQSRSKRQSYSKDDGYVSKDDYNYRYDKYGRELYTDDGYYEKDGRQIDYARDDGYGHGGGYDGGHEVSHSTKDIYSVLAFSAFVLAICYLIWYCLPDPTRCDGQPDDTTPRKRSYEPQSLSRVARETHFILGLIERAENVWRRDYNDL